MRKFTDVIQDQGGNIVAGAELYVRKQSDNSLVNLYSDDGVTQTANPAVSASDGYVTFWTADNTLKFELYVDGELEKTIEQVQHFDLDDISTFIWTLLNDTDAATARGTLGLGTISTQAANNVAITGGSVAGITDLAIADGGTGASTAAGARTNLGLVIGTDVLGMGGGTLTGDLSVPDEAYDATAWNASTEVPTKNAVRDKIESLTVPSETLIEEWAADGTTGTHTFSSLGSFRHLRIVVNGAGDTAATSVQVRARFNGDTGNNYDYQRITAVDTTAAGSAAASQAFFLLGFLPAASALANDAGVIRFEIGDYRGTTFFKTGMGSNSWRSGGAVANFASYHNSSWWRSTAAITSIEIFASAGNFVNGSKVSIYGYN